MILVTAVLAWRGPVSLPCSVLSAAVFCSQPSCAQSSMEPPDGWASLLPLPLRPEPGRRDPAQPHRGSAAYHPIGLVLVVGSATPHYHALLESYPGVENCLVDVTRLLRLPHDAPRDGRTGFDTACFDRISRMPAFSPLVAAGIEIFYRTHTCWLSTVDAGATARWQSAVQSLPTRAPGSGARASTLRSRPPSLRALFWTTYGRGSWCILPGVRACRSRYSISRLSTGSTRAARLEVAARRSRAPRTNAAGVRRNFCRLLQGTSSC